MNSPVEREKRSSGSQSGGSIYSCSVANCGKKFRSSKELNRHLSKTHGISRSYKCQICSLSFPKRKALQEHVQKHISGNRFFCEEPGCEKTFADKSSLKYHISVHVSPVALIFLARKKEAKRSSRSRGCQEGGGRLRGDGG